MVLLVKGVLEGGREPFEGRRRGGDGHRSSSSSREFIGMFSKRRARFKSIGEGIVRRCVFAIEAARRRRERRPGC